MSAFSVFWWRVSEFAAKRCGKYQSDEFNQKSYIKYFNKWWDETSNLTKKLACLKEIHEVELLQKDEEIRRLSDLVYELDKELRE